MSFFLRKKRSYSIVPVVLCGAGEEVDTMLEKRQIKGNLAIEENQQRIIVIEAKEKPKNLKLRVAAYARVSTNSEIGRASCRDRVSSPV